MIKENMESLERYISNMLIEDRELSRSNALVWIAIDPEHLFSDNFRKLAAQVLKKEENFDLSDVINKD